MTEAEVNSKFDRLFTASHNEHINKVKNKGLKIAHYTTAENAAMILENKTLWLRNAAMMNDFSEITYGQNCLNHALNNGLWEKIKHAIEPINPQFWEDFQITMKSTGTFFRDRTYLSSLSEHNPKSHEGQHGRLSMWRAYGGSTSGVALIFNPRFPFDGGFKSEITPARVLYGGPMEFAKNLEHIIERIKQNQDLVKHASFESASLSLSAPIYHLALSTKHPGFAEEQEWRIMNFQTSQPSGFINKKVATIRGIPQVVYEIPLRNHSNDPNNPNAPQLDLDQLLHQVIIGPCQYPYQVKEALCVIMDKSGISDPEGRITISGIPLRQ